jgi:hypothetical protein
VTSVYTGGTVCQVPVEKALCASCLQRRGSVPNIYRERAVCLEPLEEMQCD